MDSNGGREPDERDLERTHSSPQSVRARMTSHSVRAEEWTASLDDASVWRISWRCCIQSIFVAKRVGHHLLASIHNHHLHESQCSCCGRLLLFQSKQSRSLVCNLKSTSCLSIQQGERSREGGPPHGCSPSLWNCALGMCVLRSGVASVNLITLPLSLWSVCYSFEH